MILFDLDGTLSDCGHRLSMIRNLPEGGKPDWDAFHAACVNDQPIRPVCELLLSLARAGRELQIWTGRDEKVRESTRSWFRAHCPLVVQYEIPLRMRPTGDHRPDTELKAQWLEELLREGWRVDFVVEDRTRMVNFWRSRGIVCLQCAPGDF